MKIKHLLFFSAAWAAFLPLARGGEITAVPGPDNQGGMIMPMVSITGFDDLNNPTTGTVSIMFSPASIPVLRSLQEWSPGNWFAPGASWRPDLGSPEGVGGTPAANAGNGDLFSNRYGFMFTTSGGTRPSVASLAANNMSMAIKLTSLSSSSLESYNYVNAQNRWDQVFPTENTQILWNGSMWHNYFTLPSSAPAGTYTAQFEIFVADTPFTGTTGFAQYDAAAAAAIANPNFTPGSLTYTFEVVPEPSTTALLALGVSGAAWFAAKRRRR
jgi:hypothetical protein